MKREEFAKKHGYNASVSELRKIASNLLDKQRASLPSAEGVEDDLTTIRKIFDRNGFDFDAFEYENEYSSANLIASMREFAAIKQQQPTAEGAEEILYKHTCCMNPYKKHEIIDAMQEFATLHAQKIADKMVSERLREETWMTCDVCGCHPSVIITTSFGKFCQQHAKYV